MAPPYKPKMRSLSKPHTLSNPGIKILKPPNVFTINRAPTINDSAKFDIGDFWIDSTSGIANDHDVWMLVSLSEQRATWINLRGGQVETLTGDNAVAVGPDANDNITIAGGANITTTGTLLTNTLSIDITGTTPYVVQIGNATGALTDVAGLGNVGNVLTSQGLGNPPIWQPAGFAGCAFMAYLSADQNNVTGDGTYYDVPFDLTEFDLNGNFDTVNHWLLVPYDGYYQIVSTVFFRNIDPTVVFDNATIRISRYRPSDLSTRTYVHDNINPQPITDNTTLTYEWDSNNIDICYFLAGDRITLQAMVGNATKTCGLTGVFGINLRTTFSSWLLYRI